MEGPCRKRPACLQLIDHLYPPLYLLLGRLYPLVFLIDGLQFGQFLTGGPDIVLVITDLPLVVKVDGPEEYVSMMSISTKVTILILRVLVLVFL
jgi:hypothetical protein